MEKEQHRLTDAPPDPSAGEANGSDLEFSDVFGGPPIRSRGIGGCRRRRSDSIVAVGNRDPLRRRARLGEDFFQDIFRGGKGSASSRTSLRDLFALDRSPERPRRASFDCVSSPISCSEKTSVQLGFPASHASLDDTSLENDLEKYLEKENHDFATASGGRHPKECSADKESNIWSSKTSYFSRLKSACGIAMFPVSPDSEERSQNNDGYFLLFLPLYFVIQNEDVKDFAKDGSNYTGDIKGQKVEMGIAQSDAKEILISLEDKLNLGRTSEKVKYFLRKFHQEFSCKKIKCIEPQSRTFKVKEVGNNKEESCHVYKVGVDKEDISSGIAQSSVSISSVLMGETCWTVEPESSSFNARQAVFVTHSGTVTADIDSILQNIDEICADIEEPICEIEEETVESLKMDFDRISLFDTNTKELRNADLTLKEWSSGKEGNIRSLLSTLHYVLWSGSGWRPVRLVDLVDCTSVKKAYLKAMLTLHPDKLQQRDVPTHQKYIAEKVFDILQEAWSEFSSKSPV